MARDEDLSLAVLQGAGLSQVGLYPLSVLGRWPPLHTLDEAALRHSRAGQTLFWIVWIVMNLLVKRFESQIFLILRSINCYIGR